MDEWRAPGRRLGGTVPPAFPSEAPAHGCQAPHSNRVIGSRLRDATANLSKEGMIVMNTNNGSN